MVSYNENDGKFLTDVWQMNGFEHDQDLVLNGTRLGWHSGKEFLTAPGEEEVNQYPCLGVHVVDRLGTGKKYCVRLSWQLAESPASQKWTVDAMLTCDEILALCFPKYMMHSNSAVKEN